MKKLLLILSALLFSGYTINAQTKDTTKTRTSAEVMPEFPGGLREMMLYIQKNIKYPKRARKNNIGGKCFIRFTVMKDGSIDSLKILKGVPDCPECDAEAVRVIKKMPKWSPATVDGKPVSVYFNLPINFTIKEKN